MCRPSWRKKPRCSFTEPQPVKGTEVFVQFNDASEPDAEQRVRVLLDRENENWAEFLEFMATSTTQ